MISLRSAYEQQGYILLKGVLPQGLLDAHSERVARVYDRYGLQSEADIKALASSDGQASERFHEDVTSLHNDEQGLALTLHATLRDTVAEIIGADPIRVSGFTTRWGSEAEPGVDTSVVWRGPWQTACRTWCAIKDVQMEAGPIYIYPGSHLSLGTVSAASSWKKSRRFKTLLTS